MCTRTAISRVLLLTATVIAGAACQAGERTPPPRFGASYCELFPGICAAANESTAESPNPLDSIDLNKVLAHCVEAEVHAKRELPPNSLAYQDVRSYAKDCRQAVLNESERRFRAGKTFGAGAGPTPDAQSSSTLPDGDSAAVAIDMNEDLDRLGKELGLDPAPNISSAEYDDGRFDAGVQSGAADAVARRETELPAAGNSPAGSLLDEASNALNPVASQEQAGAINWGAAVEQARHATIQWEFEEKRRELARRMEAERRRVEEEARDEIIRKEQFAAERRRQAETLERTEAAARRDNETMEVFSAILGGFAQGFAAAKGYGVPSYSGSGGGPFLAPGSAGGGASALGGDACGQVHAAVQRELSSVSRTGSLCVDARQNRASAQRALSRLGSCNAGGARSQLESMITSLKQQELATCTSGP